MLFRSITEAVDLDWAGKVNRFGDGVGVFRVVGMISGYKDDVGTDFFGFADLSAGFDAESLGLVAGGDAACGVGHCGDDGERLAAVLRVELLLDGRKEAVQVDVQEAEAVGMEGIGHGTVWGNYIRFLFAFDHVVRYAEWIPKV